MSSSSLVIALALLSVAAGCGGSTSAVPPGPDGDASDASLGDGGTSPTDGGLLQDGASAVDTTCSGPGTCELGEPGCCGIGCGMPTVGSYVGIRRGQQDALFRATCAEPNDVSCPGCAVMADPNLQAFCRNSKCTVIDIRVDTVSTCAKDEDCILRAAECCPCGTVTESALVAVANSDEYGNQICDPQQVCGKCAWVLPTNKRAACDPSTKHCTVANK